MERFKNARKYLRALALAFALSAASRGPARASDPSLQVPPLRGRLVLQSMPLSPTVHRKITTWTYLPPGYGAPENASRRYPVVYLLHGQPGGWMDCFLSGHVEEMADRLISGGEVAPMILVAFDADGPRGAKDLTNFCNRATDGYRAEDMIVSELEWSVAVSRAGLASSSNRLEHPMIGRGRKSRSGTLPGGPPGAWAGNPLFPLLLLRWRCLD